MIVLTNKCPYASVDDGQINNAAIVSGPAPGLDGVKVTYANAKAVLDTNYFGVKNVTEGLLPVLRASPAGARVVSLTSRVGLYEVGDS